MYSDPHPDGQSTSIKLRAQALPHAIDLLGRGTGRIDPQLVERLWQLSQRMTGCDSKGAIDGDDDHFPLGEAPAEWLQKRILVVATADGEYADICISEWISRLRRALVGHLERFGLDDIDASALQKTARRMLTQLMSRIVFNAGFSGIYYLSKCDHDIENRALFEPFHVTVRKPEPIRVDESDLQLALRLHPLRFRE